MPLFPPHSQTWRTLDQERKAHKLRASLLTLASIVVLFLPLFWHD
jgi:hypothetical protein